MFRFWSFARIRVDGLNLDKLFKIFKKNNIAVFNVKRTSYKQIFFNVKSSQVKNLLISLNKPCYNVTVEKHYGISKVFSLLKKRIGVSVGVLVFTIIVIVLSSFVWSIEVYGNEDISDAEVMSALTSAGVTVGKTFDNKQIEYAENYLQQNLNKVSMVSVIKKGSSIIVNIKEVRSPEVMNMVGTSSDLVSDFEGLVTAVNLVQGTPLVQVGDTVQMGDTLIAGYFNTLNGNKTNCIAMGDVFAKVWYSSTLEFDENLVINRRTGKSK